jgi:hypothetical protein
MIMFSRSVPHRHRHSANADWQWLSTCKGVDSKVCLLMLFGIIYADQHLCAAP